MPLWFLNINIFKTEDTKEGIKMSLVLSEDFLKKESYKQSLGVTEPLVWEGAFQGGACRGEGRDRKKMWTLYGASLGRNVMKVWQSVTIDESIRQNSL